METLQMIIKCIKNNTLLFCRDDKSCINTIQVANEVNISRSAASKYLNQLVEDKQLIKISTRPVIFYHRKTIEEELKIKITLFDFISKEEFLDYIKNAKRKYDWFESAIGYKTSLNECILKLKSKIKYPGDLATPVIISGARGTGKKFLIKLLFEYAKAEGSIGADQKIYILNCMDETIDYYPYIFGNDTENEGDIGYLEAATDSILYINDADCLNINTQNELAFYLENGYFYRKNDKLSLQIKSQ